jgi:hypothetical protein
MKQKDSHKTQKKILESKQVEKVIIWVVVMKINKKILLHQFFPSVRS